MPMRLHNFQKNYNKKDLDKSSQRLSIQKYRLNRIA